MSQILADGFRAVVVSAASAFVAGWWLRGLRLMRSASAAAPRKRGDRRQLTEQALAGSARRGRNRALVRRSSTSSAFKAIETELRESSATEPAMISNAADSIIAANGLVQHQFNDIQQMLDNRQVEMQDHVSDPYGLLFTFASLDRQKHVYRQVLGSLEMLAAELMANIAGHGQRLQKITNGLGGRAAREAAGHDDRGDARFSTRRRDERKIDNDRAADRPAGRKSAHAGRAQPHRFADGVAESAGVRGGAGAVPWIALAARRAYFTIMFLDLDGFNQVNHQYGHQGGDVILRQTASAIKQIMRGRDMVARYAGDTFAVLLHQTTLHDALPVADELRARDRANGIQPRQLSAAADGARWASRSCSRRRRRKTSRRRADEALRSGEAGAAAIFAIGTTAR